MTTKPDLLPQTGGSFIREKNGDLTKIGAPTDPEAAEVVINKPTAQHSKKET